MYIFWKMLNIRGREVVGLYIYLEILSMLKVLKIPIPFLQILNVFYTCKIFNVQRSILANFQYCRFLQVSEVPTLQILNDLQFWDAYILQILNIDDLWGAYIENSQYLRSLHLQIFNVQRSTLANFQYCRFLQVFEVPTLQILDDLQFWDAYIFSNSQYWRSLRCLHWKFSMFEVSLHLYKSLRCIHFKFLKILNDWGLYISTLFKFSMLKGSTLFKFSILSVSTKSLRFIHLQILEFWDAYILQNSQYWKFFNFSMFKVSAIQIFNV